jgi:hypothetical protein
MRAGSRSQRLDDTLVELPGVRTAADEVKEAPWIEIIGQMQKVELLADHAHHTGQRRSDRVGSRHASLFVQLIGQPSADTMRLAFDT